MDIRKSFNIIAVLLVGLFACLLDGTNATHLARRLQRTLSRSKAKAHAKGSITLKNFLVISQARLSTVSYVNLDEVHAGGGNGDEPPKIHTLINFNLTTPSGLALCDGKLYVADPVSHYIYRCCWSGQSVRLSVKCASKKCQTARIYL